MRKHLGKRERAARKQHKRRGTVTTSRPGMSGWLTFKLGNKKFAEYMKNDSVEKFRGCVVDAER